MSARAVAAGRYRLERPLGQGGMATVYLGRDSELDRPVAVKVLADHLAGNEAFRERFLREARLAARLSHPNVVSVYDAGEEADGRPYIVMEHVEGETLGDVLRERGRLPIGEAVGLALQACRGLAHAHAAGLVHRDVKPQNLLLRGDGTLKIADFGIARAAESTALTQAGTVLGTAAYLSPEQARGEPAGPASDLYALGVVSYQLLAGRLPFDAASLTDLARQQDTTSPPPLHELDPEIPRALSLVVARALERNPDDRFADAGAMERALADSLRGVAPEPTEATRPLDETESTRALDRTAVTTPLARTQPAQRRRRMEPIAEPPRREPPAARRPAPAAPPQRARTRRPGGALRALRTLLILALLCAIGAGAYVLIDQGSQRSVQPREQVEGNVDQAVDEIQGLIEDNTR